MKERKTETNLRVFILKTCWSSLVPESKMKRRKHVIHSLKHANHLKLEFCNLFCFYFLAKNIPAELKQTSNTRIKKSNTHKQFTQEDVKRGLTENLKIKNWSEFNFKVFFFIFIFSTSFFNLKVVWCAVYFTQSLLQKKCHFVDVYALKLLRE